jgi:hypothetical protein
MTGPDGYEIRTRLSGSPSEWVGHRPAIGIDDRGWSELDASAVDRDIPTLQVYLLVVVWA